MGEDRLTIFGLFDIYLLMINREMLLMKRSTLSQPAIWFRFYVSFTAIIGRRLLCSKIQLQHRKTGSHCYGSKKLEKDGCGRTVR